MSERFTERDLYQWLGTPDPWFEKGSDLYEAALLLRSNLGVPPRDVLIVGQPVATRCGSSFETKQYGEARRQVVAAMVFAMAVECWLKGLIVASMPRHSRDTWRKVTDALQIPDIDKLTDDEYLDSVTSVLEDESTQSLIRSFGEQSHTENKVAWDCLKSHNHDLLKLAEVAKVILLKEEQEFLRFLTGAIWMGRYPSAKKLRDCVQWEWGEPVNSTMWEAITSAVHERYQVVVLIPELNKSLNDS